MAQENSLLDFLGHSVICTKRHRRESPHKLPAKLLKSFLVAGTRIFVTHFTVCPYEGGGSIAFANLPSTFIFHLPLNRCSAAAVVSRGAQYSRPSRLVNALS